MKVLHLYDTNDELIAQHVTMLEIQGAGFTTQTVSSPLEKIQVEIPDLVHVHGCWNRSVSQQAERLSQQGARIVLTPHGALQPWILSQQRPVEKTTQSALWQRRLVQQAYAVIAQGKMEYDGLRKLGWNPRVELIRNAVTTNTITPEEMRRQTSHIYQKVMDSYTLPLLSPDTVKLLAILLKAGITGDKRWVNSQFQIPNSEYITWRQLLLYADHENVRQFVDRGISIMGISAPQLITANIKAYLPQDYKQPVPLTTYDPVAIAQHTMSEPLSLLRLVELDHALRQPDIDDNSLADELADQSMTRHFQRLLQLLSEQTMLDEGFMPLPPINDRLTQQMRRQLATHLKVI